MHLKAAWLTTLVLAHTATAAVMASSTSEVATTGAPTLFNATCTLIATADNGLTITRRVDSEGHPQVQPDHDIPGVSHSGPGSPVPWSSSSLQIGYRKSPTDNMTSLYESADSDDGYFNVWSMQTQIVAADEIHLDQDIRYTSDSKVPSFSCWINYANVDYECDLHSDIHWSFGSSTDIQIGTVVFPCQVKTNWD